jgi:hypothetical protein
MATVSPSTHPVSAQFILAGNAYFTVQEPNGSHHTFRVSHKEANGNYKECWFVSFLSGSNNETDYTYLGMLDSFTGQVKTTKASAALEGCFKLRLLNRILARVWSEDHQAYEQHGYKTHHEGRCGRCGRLLTVPESIERGIGPECAAIMGIDTTSSEEAANASYDSDDTLSPVRNDGGHVTADGTLVYDVSEAPANILCGLTPHYDREGDVLYWDGVRNGQKITVFND